MLSKTSKHYQIVIPSEIVYFNSLDMVSCQSYDSFYKNTARICGITRTDKNKQTYYPTILEIFDCHKAEERTFNISDMVIQDGTFPFPFSFPCHLQSIQLLTRFDLLHNLLLN